jgi:DNA-binding CsgD family transcriptional regulator
MIQGRNQSTLIVGLLDKPYDICVDPGLTKREEEILKYITESDKMIAHLLNISYRTVVNHSVKIRLKTGCKSKGHLIDYAAKRNQVIN